MLANQSQAMQAYRESMASVEALDRESERELARRWRAGDKRAGDKLVTACLPFVIAIALEYRRWGVPLEDIVQQGNLGLLRAASKFDLNKDCRLATYAASAWARPRRSAARCAPTARRARAIRRRSRPSAA
jgi:RNA polymerase sigma-32 factor